MPEDMENYLKETCVPLARDELSKRMNELMVLLGYEPLDI
jgi:hypothetical protein